MNQPHDFGMQQECFTCTSQFIRENILKYTRLSKTNHFLLLHEGYSKVKLALFLRHVHGGEDYDEHSNVVPLEELAGLGFL